MGYAADTEPRPTPCDVDDLLAAAEALDDAAFVAFLDALAGSRRVQDAGWTVRERRIGAERFPERNRKIRMLAKRLTYGQIANKLGMSRSAVAKICQRGRIGGFVMQMPLVRQLNCRRRN